MKRISRMMAAMLAVLMLVSLLPAAPAHAAGAGWVKEDGVWYYTNAAGEKITNDWVKSSGKWYYFGEDGAMAADTWVDDYYMNASGVMQASKWVAVGDDWAYVSASGVRVKSGWQKIGGNWYWFADGLMVTGPVAVDGKNYFFKDNGPMLTGWRQDEDGWHYYSASGARVETGWQKIGSNWYWFADGLMVTGPVVIDGQSYFFKDSGAMLTGWVKDGDSWRYFGSNGIAYAGKWLSSGGKWYYFDADGLMLADAWLTDGGKTYHFAASGAMQTGWQQLDGSWYYFKGGAMQVGWLQLGGSWYYFTEDGVMVTGEVEIDGEVNLFKDSGAWVKVKSASEPADDNILTAANFPDSYLREMLQALYPNGLSAEDAAKVTSIPFPGFDSMKGHAMNLKGLEYFTGLTEITINAITEIDTLDLSLFPALESLELTYGQKLNTLIIDNPKLQSVIIAGSLVTPTLSSVVIRSAPALTHLGLTNAKLAALDLSNAPKLEELSLKGAMSALDLRPCPQLKMVTVDSSELTELDLRNSAKLEVLNISKSKLSNLDVSKLSSLTRLQVYESPLTALDVSMLPGLTMLNLYNDCLTELDLSQNKALEYADVNDQQGGSLALQLVDGEYHVNLSGLVSAANLGKVTQVQNPDVSGPDTTLAYDPTTGDVNLGTQKPTQLLYLYDTGGTVTYEGPRPSQAIYMTVYVTLTED